MGLLRSVTFAGAIKDKARRKACLNATSARLFSRWRKVKREMSSDWQIQTSFRCIKTLKPSGGGAKVLSNSACKSIQRLADAGASAGRYWHQLRLGAVCMAQAVDLDGCWHIKRLLNTGVASSAGAK